ncbi:MAG: OsmC family protein, partial [Acinetobacter sp.]
KKARQDVTDVVCELKAERADTIPAVFTKIHLHFVVTGKAVKEKQVAKAIELSAEKYCSASKMLTDGGVEITHDFEIIEAT